MTPLLVTASVPRRLPAIWRIASSCSCLASRRGWRWSSFSTACLRSGAFMVYGERTTVGADAGPGAAGAPGAPMTLTFTAGAGDAIHGDAFCFADIIVIM